MSQFDGGAVPLGAARDADERKLRLDIVSDQAGLQRLRSQWNDLLKTSRANNIFLTWEWISIWWDVYGWDATLHILTACDQNNRLVGVAPLKRTRQGVHGLWRFDAIEFIGQGGDVTPEYLDFICARELEAEIVDMFVDALYADRRISAIDLRPLSERSPNLDRVQQRLRNRNGRMRCVPESVCPIFALPESAEAFMAGRSRNYRKKIREYERRCERDLHVATRLSATTDELRRDMDDLVRLHHSRWDGASRAFQSNKYLEFHRRLGSELFDRGWIRLFSLTSGTTALASLYCFAYDGHYYYYQAGRDPSFPKHHLGLVLMHKAILQAIHDKAVVFDFLRGQEAYKYHWASEATTNVRLVFWRDARSLAAARVQRAIGWLGAAAAALGGRAGRVGLEKQA